MSIVSLASKAIRQINLSLHTPYFPITIKALIKNSKTHFSDVKAMTKISFLGDHFNSITLPGPFRQAVLIPSVVEDNCIAIVRFDAFLSSE